MVLRVELREDRSLNTLLVDDAALTAAWVSANVPSLLTDPDRLSAMGAAAEGLIPRDADERLAEMVLEVAGGGS